MAEENFRSGSHWNKKELTLLNFALKPEDEQFDKLRINYSLSATEAETLRNIREGFGVPNDIWEEETPQPRFGSYEAFYRKLRVLTAPKLIQSSPPRQYSGRSTTTNIPGLSSKFTPERKPIFNDALASSPPPFLQQPTTPSTSRHSRIAAQHASQFTSSPPPAPQLSGSARTDGGGGQSLAPIPLPEEDFNQNEAGDSEYNPSSQTTDSTYVDVSSHASSDTESATGLEDHAETEVLLFAESFLDSITVEHNSRTPDFSLKISSTTKPLTVTLVDETPTSTPDYRIDVMYEKKRYPMLDVELKRPRTNTPGATYGQEVAHLLMRGNTTIAESRRKFEKTDTLDTYLITIHGTKLRICKYKFRPYRIGILSWRLPLQTDGEQTVQRYGSLELGDTNERIEAVTAIYKLMLLQARFALWHKGMTEDRP